MAQIYGIDLASEKFDVSFVDNEGKIHHKVVKNTRSQIEKFLETLPQDCRLVAEYTGVYGDLLLMLADIRSIPVSYVSGYEIKHSMGLTRGKSDPIDAVRIREYGERHEDKLPETHSPRKPFINFVSFIPPADCWLNSASNWQPCSKETKSVR